MINKKAQGLPLTVIIIAVIALVVLVVVIAIFAGKIGLFGKGVTSCTGKGGKCYNESCSRLNMPEIENTDCPDNLPHCCIEFPT